MIHELTNAQNERKYQLKIIDFNLSRILNKSSNVLTICGTLPYMAPEFFFNNSTEAYDARVDVW